MRRPRSARARLSPAPPAVAPARRPRRGPLARHTTDASALAERAPARATMEHFIETVRKYPCLWNTTAIEYRDQELKDAAWTEVMKETELASVKEVKLKWKKLRDSYRDALKRQSEMLAKEPGQPAKKSYPWKYMGLMQFLKPYMSNRRKPPPSATPPPHAHAHARAHDDNGHHLNHNGVDGHSSEESDSEAEGDSGGGGGGACAEEPSPKRKSVERLTVIDRKLDFLCKAQTKRQCTEAHHYQMAQPQPQYRRETPPPAPAPAPASVAPAPQPDPLDIFFNSMCQSTKRFPFPAQIKIKKKLFAAVIEAEEALLAEQQSYASLWARGAASSSSSDADADADAEAGADADADADAGDDAAADHDDDNDPPDDEDRKPS